MLPLLTPECATVQTDGKPAAAAFTIKEDEGAEKRPSTTMAAATVVEAEPSAGEGGAAFSGVQNRGWDESQLRQYCFPTKPIPRLSHTDPRAEMLINNEVKQSAWKKFEHMDFYSETTKLYTCCKTQALVRFCSNKMHEGKKAYVYFKTTRRD